MQNLKSKNYTTAERMNILVNEFMKENLSEVERLIIRHLQDNNVSNTIERASIYSVEAGGKRFRPLLLFSTLETLGIPAERGIAAASALEMIHTYSLIHDDLPAMDDDDLRRGQPTNHKVFGEATAILAGDNLLTESFNVILNDAMLSDTMKVSLLKSLNTHSGQNGMIGGQMLDIEAETEVVTLESLVKIHRYKTGALIRAAVEMACIIAEVEASRREMLIKFSETVGVFFQIRDDILDVTSSVEVLGKHAGSDESNNKTTYVSEYGLEGAYQELARYEQEAVLLLDMLKDDYNIKPLESIIIMLKI